MADASTATENAAAADEATELARLRAAMASAQQQIREFAERSESDLATLRAQLAEVRRQRDVDGQTCADALEMADDLLERLRDAHDLLDEWQRREAGDLSARTRAYLQRRRVRLLAEVDADIVSVVRARYRAGCLAWLGERLSELCRETTLPRSEHRYGPCSDGASPPASPAGAAYRAAVDAAAEAEHGEPDDACGCEASDRLRAEVERLERLTEDRHAPNTVEWRQALDTERSRVAELHLKVRLALQHLRHHHCPQNNAYVMKAIEILGS